MKENKIYIGLNDQDTRQQRFDTEKYTKLLKKVCINYRVPFSISVSEGGYFHEDGAFTAETSLVMTLIDVPNETIEEIARDVCVFFHQESVLVTESTVKAVFIREHL